MSIDLLHDKIRKMKNPSVIDFVTKADGLPPHLLEEEGNLCSAYERFCRELLEGLVDTVPGVRFSLGAFSLLGGQGLDALERLLLQAKNLGFYVLLDAPEILSPWCADRAADMIFGENRYVCDGLVISPFIGSDGMKPFLDYCRNDSKDLFVIVRSPNKSASELQDLLTGTRHVHGAAAELVARQGEKILGKCGYSRVCGVAAAGNGELLRTLRTKHNRMFLLVDGLDYPGGNAKNCSYAFDRFGFGAAVCAGPSVTAAWKESDSDGRDYVNLACLAAERMKKNLTRYVSVL